MRHLSPFGPELLASGRVTDTRDRHPVRRKVNPDSDSNSPDW
ncbi:hypothetical protein [Maioricimonas sp. JC845]